MCDYIELNHHLRRLDVTVGKAFDEAALSRFEKVVLASSRSVRKLNLQNVRIHETIDIFVNNDLTSNKYPRDFRYVCMNSWTCSWTRTRRGTTCYSLTRLWLRLCCDTSAYSSRRRHATGLYSIKRRTSSPLARSESATRSFPVSVKRGPLPTLAHCVRKTVGSYHQRRRAMEERCEK